MGAKSYDDLVSNVVTKLGIDRGAKKTTNQSLRSTTFNVQLCMLCEIFYYKCVCQDMLGCSPAQKRLVSGHISDKTADVNDISELPAAGPPMVI